MNTRSRTRRPLTEAERSERWNEGATFKQEYVATGFLRGKIPVYLTKGIPVTWTEVDEKPFETFVGEVAATILTALAYRKAERERYEAEARNRWKREQAIKAEEARRQTLHGLASNWRRASELRAYVEAVTTAARAGKFVVEEPALSEWSTWALMYASELDPIDSGVAIPREDPPAH